MRQEKVFAIKWASLYPMYLKKAQAKGRLPKELDQVICWLTGYTPEGLHQQIQGDGDLEAFFAQAPAFNPKAVLVTGTVCGVRVEDVEHPLMRRIRQLDKLVDELARGRWGRSCGSDCGLGGRRGQPPYFSGIGRSGRSACQ